MEVLKILDQLKDIIAGCVRAACPEEAGEQVEGLLSGDILMPCKNPEHGDYTSAVSMRLASILRRKPLDIAGDLSEKIRAEIEKAGVPCSRVEVAPPGFINFALGTDALSDVLSSIIDKNEKYGTSDFGKNEKVLIEFVSANPTGPLTVAHGRQAAVGDSLGRIMNMAGFDATNEYYLNDRGRQMNILAQSTLSRYLQEFEPETEFPEDGYQGEYIRDLGRRIKDEHGDKFVTDTPERQQFFLDYAKDEIMSWIRRDLEEFRVKMDVWFSEREFATEEVIQKTLSDLKDAGFAYEEDGAMWLASSKFGDEKDRVLVKSSGDFTYITPDIAYHINKYERGFERLINLWGPDHHGYIPRIKAGVKALGQNPDALNVLIVQLCTLFRQGQKVSMSTRAGEFVSLREVIDEVGADAARFYFLMLKPGSHLNFDLEVAKQKSMDNPVYYIQYAHARICSVFSKYEETYGKVPEFDAKDYDISLLASAEENNIINALIRFPDAVASSARSLDPHEIINYLQSLSSDFHSYYNKFRVIGEEEGVVKARCYLLRAVQTVVKNGLELLGVSAPDKM